VTLRLQFKETRQGAKYEYGGLESDCWLGIGL